MKHSTVLMTTLFVFGLLTSIASAQTHPPFHVGVHGFAPEWDPDAHVLHYVEGYVPSPSGDYQRQHFVGQSQFDSARALGANMISLFFDRDSILTVTDNAVHQICDAAAPLGVEPLDVVAMDFGVGDFLSGERIMFHPESE